MRAWRVVRTGFKSGDALRRRIHTTPTCHSQAGNSNNVAGYLSRSEGAIENASLHGWVRSVRKQKKIAFAAINDGSTTDSLQAVLTPEDAASLSTGVAVRLDGKWVPSAGRGQSHEFQASAVQVLGENHAEDNPLQPKFQTPEFLRTIPHLRARTPINGLLLRLRSHLIASLTRFFEEREFVQTHTPIITSSDCEGAGEVFAIVSGTSSASNEPAKPRTVDTRSEQFFRTSKYLTVSAQLHLEALAQAVDKVWTLSPTFRAEKSDTSRHLSEFYMLEAEICFTRDMSDILSLVEDMLRSVVRDLSSSRVYRELLQQERNGSVSAADLEKRWAGMSSKSWPRITYSRAVELLKSAHESGKANFETSPTHEGGLLAEHERYIAVEIGQGTPVFVTDYPRVQKPFYMLPSLISDNSQGTADTVACFDLLVPELCELMGGSLREHRPADLTRALEEKGIAGHNLEWYQDLRKYGGVPHGGFGLGFDRLIGYLSGVSNVRDVVAFPRWCGRCDC